MSSLERLEQLFAPIYWFLMAVGYVYMFLRLIPAAVLGFLLGFVTRGLLWPRIDRRLRQWRLAPTGRRTVLLLWEAAVLVLSAGFGSGIGWWAVYAETGRVLGACAGAAGFFLGYLLAVQKNKEV